MPNITRLLVTTLMSDYVMAFMFTFQTLSDVKYNGKNTWWVEYVSEYDIKCREYPCDSVYRCLQMYDHHVIADTEEEQSSQRRCSGRGCGGQCQWEVG